MKGLDSSEDGEITQLRNFFDTLPLYELDREGLSKRFPHIVLANGEFDIGGHIYDTFIFSRLADIVVEGNYSEAELSMFIEGYLDGILVTVRKMLQSFGINIDSSIGLGISDAFVKLKGDLPEVLSLYPAGTRTKGTLETFRGRVGGISH